MNKHLSNLSQWIGTAITWKGWEPIAAIAAAVAAVAAWKAADSAATAPYRQTTYEARREALRDYTVAQGKLHGVLMGNLVDLKIEDPATLTDRELETMAVLARPTLDRFYDYTTAVNASRSVWSSKDFDRAIETAGEAANVATLCYKQLIVYAGRPADDRQSLRQDINSACSDLGYKVDSFDTRSNSVIAMMQPDVEAAWNARPPKPAGD